MMLGFIKLKIIIINYVLAILLACNLVFGYLTIEKLNIEKELLSKEIKKQSIINTFNDFNNRLKRIIVGKYKKDGFINLKVLRQEPRELNKLELQNIIFSKNLPHKNEYGILYGIDYHSEPENTPRLIKLNPESSKVLLDKNTNLMWNGISSEYIEYNQTKNYIEELNSNHYGGYSNWRLPTTEELLSIISTERNSDGNYISELFTLKGNYPNIDVWSSDSFVNADPWIVRYSGYGIERSERYQERLVLAVRN